MDTRKVLQMADVDDVIKCPELLPWKYGPHFSCSACGAGITLWDRFCSFLLNRNCSIVNVVFCVGGKPLAETLPPIQQMISGQEERKFSCAGIFEPHLHLSCRCCGKSCFMKTKEESR